MSLFALQGPTRQDIVAAVADAVDAAWSAVEPSAWAMDMSALRLAQELADLFGAPLDQVWHSLCNVPENMLVMLDSPQGWSALAAVVAFDIGVPAPGYAPLLH